MFRKSRLKTCKFTLHGEIVAFGLLHAVDVDNRTDAQYAQAMPQNIHQAVISSRYSNPKGDDQHIHNNVIPKPRGNHHKCQVYMYM